MTERRLFDAGLQPERTALAWRRTALALVVAALVAVRILPELLGAWGVLLAGLGLVASVAVLVAAHRRHGIVHRTLTGSDSDRGPLPSGWLPLAVAALVIASGVAAAVIVVVEHRPEGLAPTTPPAGPLGSALAKPFTAAPAWSSDRQLEARLSRAMRVEGSR